ncbi:ATP-binding protein [Terribacillus saccharophilus]|uniref:ATP-binding protein n=1 Tax=Terribacillus saccharophilus TaxID=361277 RepID=A0A075LL53_9BACI|nr:ATP-binding protein [Terribacillus goriensis]AIF67500.1 ATP-binding protein [Terribacillus goriensis]
MDEIITQPSATPVIQALRSIGYNSQTAVADLVDNSIDAKATKVSIDFSYGDGNGFIKIYDNGNGMNDEELQTAMTIGSKDPRSKRERNELGRFGMGLKTAAFSLGKRLTVISKKDSSVSIRCWDLDHVSKENEWLLYKSIPSDLSISPDEINGDNGTIVLIDKLDRFCGFGTYRVVKPESFFSKIKRIQKYLEMVFHVILEKDILIEINGNKLLPWNPFLEGNPRCYEGEIQYLFSNNKHVVITPYVLPHPSTFNKNEHKDAGGLKGWRDHQGFYVYRENRMVSYGDWFGLFPKDVQSELVRIRIDFSNDSDEEWKLDVKKSSVTIPEEIREGLESIGKYYRQLSQEIMLYRTKASQSGEKVKGSLNTWELYSDDNGTNYIINRNHPVLTNILRDIDKQNKRKINLYLKLLELGSPSNLLKTESIVKKEEHFVNENQRKTIIEYANILSNSGIQMNIDQISESISLMAGFESTEIATIKEILKKEVEASVQF